MIVPLYSTYVYILDFDVLFSLTMICLIILAASSGSVGEYIVFALKKNLVHVFQRDSTFPSVTVNTEQWAIELSVLLYIQIFQLGP